MEHEALILVIDRNRQNLTLLTELLQQQHYLALSVTTAAELEAILETTKMPHLALLDISCLELAVIKLLHNLKIPFLVLLEQSSQTLPGLMEIGAVDYIVKPLRKIDLLIRIKAALQLVRRLDACEVSRQHLYTVTQELTRENQRLDDLAFKDSLTGIANRRYADEYLSREWQRAIREATPTSIVMIDVDFFKAYNDRYGHQQGDQCLRQIARALKSALRRPADLVARYGGEEFIAIMPNTEVEGAIVVAESMQAHVTALDIPHERSRVSNRVTVSFGIATSVPKVGSKFEMLVTAADKALYQAKREGRNLIKTNTR